MRYQFECYTSKGGRNRNEDSLLAERLPDGLVAVVADGLGMHGAGEVASKVAAQEIADYCRKNPEPDKTSVAALDAANAAVLAVQTPACKMKSTAVLLLCKGNRAAIAHTGDSRGYYFHGGRLAFQTVDHSVSQLAVERGEITPAQIRFHEDRNRLLRALGGDCTARGEVAVFANVLPGDAFLLCSDGFWEYVTEPEMEADLAKSDTPPEWLSFLLARVGGRIDGKNDNLTAVAVFCREGEGC